MSKSNGTKNTSSRSDSLVQGFLKSVGIRYEDTQEFEYLKKEPLGGWL